MAIFNNENKPENTDNINNHEEFVRTDRSDALDDDLRVKVLSPTRLVLKRFFRNKLAITGLIIISVMFLFAFLGGEISPYEEDEVFYEYAPMMKDYAAGAYNKEYKFDSRGDLVFSSKARAQFVLALNRKQTTFDADGHAYYIVSVTDKFHHISELKLIAENITRIGKTIIYNIVDNNVIAEGLETEIAENMSAGKTEFMFEGKAYAIKSSGKTSSLYIAQELAMASLLIYDAYDRNTEFDYEFKLNAETAINTGAATFTAGNNSYIIEEIDEGIYDIFQMKGEDKTPYARVSDFMITQDPSLPDIFLTIDFKKDFRHAVETKADTFESANDKGEKVLFKIYYSNNKYTAKTSTVTRLTISYDFPSVKHWLGTDNYGMDILTRLMYGGRVSLIIGFIVIFIELILGIILGGIAGYFGKWVDNLIMRIVDIFNCIPTIPLIVIIGAIMDQQKLGGNKRIMWLMVIMGVLGWPSIARMVRGQILSLREQEFMIAAEATGISVTRRIFKHLIPNVIPQLIVVATMGLGDIILLESTLSFLGIGVKFPLASWGNIINDVTSIHVMTNYWFVWIPAGCLILLTVMGFNFIGDGLRDAFDPKMKR